MTHGAPRSAIMKKCFIIQITFSPIGVCCAIGRRPASLVNCHHRIAFNCLELRRNLAKIKRNIADRQWRVDFAHLRCRPSSENSLLPINGMSYDDHRRCHEPSTTFRIPTRISRLVAGNVELVLPGIVLLPLSDQFACQKCRLWRQRECVIMKEEECEEFNISQRCVFPRPVERLHIRLLHLIVHCLIELSLPTHTRHGFFFSLFAGSRATRIVCVGTRRSFVGWQLTTAPICDKN